MEVLLTSLGELHLTGRRVRPVGSVSECGAMFIG
jgi:hypothetical protein